MGNRVHKESTPTKVFSSPKSSKASLSVTVPSICTSPSFHLSLKKSTSVNESDQFTWNQMKALCTRQEFLTVNHLTPNILRMTAGVFEILKRQMGELIGDLNTGVLRLPETLGDKWGLGAKSSQAIVQSMTSVGAQAAGTPNTRNMIIHFVKMIYVHDLILNYFGGGKYNEALDLIKQVAVSHALLGVASSEFRMMDWFIVHYLIKNKITSDENINSLLTYLNTVSNYIILSYESQSVRHNMKQALVAKEKKSHRHNKARENFRLMKKWRNQIESFKEQETVADALLAEQMELRKKEEDMQSIDTITLKENDFIMKRFVRKKPEHPEEEEEAEKAAAAVKSAKKKSTLRSFT